MMTMMVLFQCRVAVLKYDLSFVICPAFNVSAVENGAQQTGNYVTQQETQHNALTHTLTP